jgi:hypothetical protein
MKKYKIVFVIFTILCLVSVPEIYSSESSNPNKKILKKETMASKIVSVDEVVRQPDQFKGYIGVFGKIIKIDKTKPFFILGCEDACIMMPVKYKGDLPKQGDNITAFGEIEKTENGKFFFRASRIEAK